MKPEQLLNRCLSRADINDFDVDICINASYRTFQLKQLVFKWRYHYTTILVLNFLFTSQYFVE